MTKFYSPEKAIHEYPISMSKVTRIFRGESELNSDYPDKPFYRKRLPCITAIMGKSDDQTWHFNTEKDRDEEWGKLTGANIRQ